MDQAVTRHIDVLLAGGHSATGDQADAGAQLVVTGPEGDEVFRAALARHYRADESDADLLWVRPVFGAEPAPGLPGGHAFNLSLCRRRSLAVARAGAGPGTAVTLELRTGQTARVEPAAGGELEQLHLWDGFTLLALTREEDAELDALDADSWNGRFG